MAQPTSGTTIQRPALGALAYEYMLAGSELGFIGEQVLPLFNVPEKTADYPVIPTEALLKMPETKRASKGGYNRSSWEFATGTYNCEEYGWEEPIDDSEAAMYARFFDTEKVAMERATAILLRAREQRIASLIFATGNACGNSAVAGAWSTPGTSTPKVDIATGIRLMRAASGIQPNALVMSLKVFENLMLSAELKSYLQYTSPHLISGMSAQMDTVARYFGVSRVLVGGAVKDTAKKGQATVVGDVWDDEYISICKLSSGGMDLKEPSFGRSFLWTGDSPKALVVERYREESIRSSVIRVRQNIDEAVVCAGANYLLTGVTA